LFLIGYCLKGYCLKKKFSSETAWQNGAKLGREIIITLKNSTHLEWRVGLSDTILKGAHPGTIYARFGPYIDASCQVWLYLAKQFQRRRFV
jgi:hypothetical protein